jgi:hypothetical protein
LVKSQDDINNLLIRLAKNFSELDSAESKRFLRLFGRYIIYKYSNERLVSDGSLRILTVCFDFIKKHFSEKDLQKYVARVVDEIVIGDSRMTGFANMPGVLEVDGHKNTEEFLRQKVSESLWMIDQLRGGMSRKKYILSDFNSIEDVLFKLFSLQLMGRDAGLELVDKDLVKAALEVMLSGMSPGSSIFCLVGNGYFQLEDYFNSSELEIVFGNLIIERFARAGGNAMSDVSKVFLTSSEETRKILEEVFITFLKTSAYKKIKSYSSFYEIAKLASLFSKESKKEVAEYLYTVFTKDFPNDAPEIFLNLLNFFTAAGIKVDYQMIYDTIIENFKVTPGKSRVTFLLLIGDFLKAGVKISKKFISESAIELSYGAVSVGQNFLLMACLLTAGEKPVGMRKDYFSLAVEILKKQGRNQEAVLINEVLKSKGEYIYITDQKREELEKGKDVVDRSKYMETLTNVESKVARFYFLMGIIDKTRNHLQTSDSPFRVSEHISVADKLFINSLQKEFTELTNELYEALKMQIVSTMYSRIEGGMEVGSLPIAKLFFDQLFYASDEDNLRNILRMFSAFPSQGKSWLQIAKLALGMWLNKDESLKRVFIDRCLTVEHNHGSIFNRGMFNGRYLHALDRNGLKRMLDVKSNNPDNHTSRTIRDFALCGNIPGDVLRKMYKDYIKAKKILGKVGIILT